MRWDDPSFERAVEAADLLFDYVSVIGIVIGLAFVAWLLVAAIARSA